MIDINGEKLWRTLHEMPCTMEEINSHAKVAHGYFHNVKRTNRINAQVFKRLCLYLGLKNPQIYLGGDAN